MSIHRQLHTRIRESILSISLSSRLSRAIGQSPYQSRVLAVTSKCVYRLSVSVACLNYQIVFLYTALSLLPLVFYLRSSRSIKKLGPQYWSWKLRQVLPKLLPALALMVEITYLVSEVVCGQCVVQIGYREKLLSNSGDYIKHH